MEAKLKQLKRLKKLPSRSHQCSSQTSWTRATVKQTRLKSQGRKGGKLEARTAWWDRLWGGWTEFTGKVSKSGQRQRVFRASKKNSSRLTGHKIVDSGRWEQTLNETQAEFFSVRAYFYAGVKCNPELSFPTARAIWARLRTYINTHAPTPAYTNWTCTTHTYIHKQTRARAHTHTLYTHTHTTQTHTTHTHTHTHTTHTHTHTLHTPTHTQHKHTLHTHTKHTHTHTHTHTHCLPWCIITAATLDTTMLSRFIVTAVVELMYLVWLHACHVRGTVGNSGLCCTCVTYVER